MAARCKTCGTPLNQVPFEPCAEHARHDRLWGALRNVEMGLERRREEVYDYDDNWDMFMTGKDW